MSAMQEIVGKTAVEGFLQIRNKIIFHMSSRSTSVFAWIFGYDFIQFLVIGSHHVFRIGDILESALYLE